MRRFCSFLQAVLCSFVLLPVDSAHAALMLCNHTKAPIEAAVGYREDGTWTSEGWWQIQPGLCVRAYSRPLTERFYFYFARSLGKAPTDSRGTVIWQGKYAFCVDDKAFRVTGDGNCEQRHYRTQGFHEIDLGPNVRDYTLNF